MFAALPVCPPLESIDSGGFHRVKCLSLVDYAIENIPLHSGYVPCRNLPGLGFVPPFDFLVRLEGIEVALFAAHDVEPRFIAGDFGTHLKLFGQRIESEMFLNRTPLVLGTARRHDESNGRKRREDHGYAVGPVGDGAYSHMAMIAKSD